MDAALTLSNHTWDMTTGVAIAREAGAIAPRWDGASDHHDSSVTLTVAPAWRTKYWA
ncbi:hypothetical protein KBX37_15560 [Micromonospora sp. U56]|nr:hypothetical protein [Micromonospora sp. U56]